MIRLLALRELRSLFAMPSTWFVLAALQFIFAWFFLARLDAFLELQPQLAQLANPPGVTAMVAAPMFNTVALLMMVMVPVFTMRLIAEERRNQTFALLLSAPLSSLHIALGKFMGLLIFLIVLMVSVPLMLYTLALGTNIDHGLMLSNILGLLLLVSSYVALGLYISALTTQPIIAAIGAAAEDSPWHLFSPLHHFQNFNTGLLDSSDAAFFILFTAAFLLLTMKRLHNNRVYG